MIQAAKRAINAVLRDTDVNDEELVTAFIGVEALLNSRPTPTNLFSFRCEGAVMAANARTFLSFLLIYAVSNIYFQTKLAKPIYLVRTTLPLLQELRSANET